MFNNKQTKAVFNAKSLMDFTEKTAGKKDAIIIGEKSITKNNTNINPSAIMPALILIKSMKASIVSPLLISLYYIFIKNANRARFPVYIMVKKVQYISRDGKNIKKKEAE